MVYQISRTLLLLLAVTLAGRTAWSQGATTSEPPAAPQASQPGRGGMAQVERHITALQRRLKVTPAQQPQWEAFTGVMRQNATHMEALQRDRTERVTAMTAPEDMRSYAEVARAHADDLQRLASAFDTLYAAMTPEQKAVADRTFHEFQGRGKIRARQP